MKININENRLKQIISESISKVLNEGEFTSNWGDTYTGYEKRYNTNQNLTGIVRELHTICQMYEPLCDAVDGNVSRYVQSQIQHANYYQPLVDLIAPIYSLMMNRNNVSGDEKSMTIDEIREHCLPSLERMSHVNGIGVLQSASERAVNAIKSFKQE